MKFSRSKINRVGEIISQHKNDRLEVAEALLVIYLKTRADDFSNHVVVSDKFRPAKTDKEVEIVEVSIENDNRHLVTDEPIVFNLLLRINDPSVKKFTIGLHVQNQQEIIVGTWVSKIYDLPQNKKELAVRLVVKHHNLAKGSYSTYFNVGLKDLSYGNRDYDVLHRVINFEVVDYSNCSSSVQARWTAVSCNRWSTSTRRTSSTAWVSC